MELTDHIIEVFVIGGIYLDLKKCTLGLSMHVNTYHNSVDIKIFLVNHLAHAIDNI